MIKIKVCGITRREDAQLAQDLGAWAIGFIFCPTSPVYIEPKKAMEITKGLKILKVGVFVNESPQKIEEIVKLVGLDIVQFHGDETPIELEKMNIDMIKAVSNSQMAQKFNKNKKIIGFLADYVKEGKLLGGSGKLADWDFAKELKRQNRNKLIFLAGGLNSSNIKEAINAVSPDVVDVSSGLETEGFRGIKCSVKMREFFEIIGDINNENAE